MRTFVRSNSEGEPHEEQLREKQKHGLSHSASLNEEHADSSDYFFKHESGDLPVVRSTSESIVKKSKFAFYSLVVQERGVLVECHESE